MQNTSSTTDIYQTTSDFVIVHMSTWESDCINCYNLYNAARALHCVLKAAHLGHFTLISQYSQPSALAIWNKCTISIKKAFAGLHTRSTGRITDKLGSWETQCNFGTYLQVQIICTTTIHRLLNFVYFSQIHHLYRRHRWWSCDVEIS